MTIRIVGSFVSPYVRKVLACLELKQVAYEVDPITPFYGSDEFTRMSPLRRIPVLVDGDLLLNDSSAICEWIEEKFPGHPLMPSDVDQRARARWLDEFADSRLGDLLIWGLFYPKMVHPRVWGEPGDPERIAASLAAIPAALDYLETHLPDEGFLFGEIGLADIAIASFFRNAAYADFAIDAAQWPRTAQAVAATLAHPVLEKLYRLERIQFSASIEGRRKALLDAGARLTETSVGQREPRPGIMRL